MIFISFRKYPAMQIIKYRMRTHKYSEKQLRKISAMLKDYNGSYIMSDYEEMLKVLTVQEFLSVTKTKEPKRNKHN